MHAAKKLGVSSHLKVQGEWDRISENSSIKSLARELKRQGEQPFGRAQWSLTGHAIIIEHHDCDEVQQLMPCLAEASGMSFSFITRQEIISGANTWLPTTLVDTPTLFFLEPGFWIGNHSIDDDIKTDVVADSEGTQQEGVAFRLQLALHIANDLTKHPVVLVTTLRELNSLDISLRRIGLFDRRIKLPITDTVEFAESFLFAVGKENCDETLLKHPTRLGVILKDSLNDKRRRDLLAQALHRLAWRTGRQVNIADLIQFVIYGITEEDPEPQNAMQIKRHAVHEAGHALVSIKNSGGVYIPEYCSVQTLSDSNGVVMPSATQITKMNDDPGIGEMLHSIRVNLAGRAAEQVVFGVMDISVKGSRSDLINATSLAYSMFSKWGISPSFFEYQKVGSNLAVAKTDQELGSSARTDAIVRKFLEEQYKVVLSQIEESRHLLDVLTSRLISQSVLVKEDIEAIFSQRSSDGTAF
jgi:hypothetical protein